MRFLPSSPILPSSQSSEHGGSLRHAAVWRRDSAGTKIETQAKLGQAEFRYLSQQEPEGTRTSKPLSAASRLWIDAEASRFRLITIATTGSYRAIASEKREGCASKRSLPALALPTLLTSQEHVVEGRGFAGKYPPSLGAAKPESSWNHFAIPGCLQISSSQSDSYGRNRSLVHERNRHRFRSDYLFKPMYRCSSSSI